MEIVRNKRKAGVLEEKEAGKVTALQIERVIGLSAPNSRTVCFCPSEADLLCYPAGSFAVVFNTATRQQLQLLRSTTSNNPLKCVCWSTNGDYIAAGEDAANASVFVWCLDSGKCMQELKAHRQSVASLCFSLDGKLLASVGAPNDGQLCLWDWQGGNLLWKQSIGPPLSSAAFTEDSSHILAVGKGLFKAWSIAAPQQQPGRAKDKSGYSTVNNSNGLSLTARPVTLRDLRSSSFVDVCMAPCQPGQPHGSNGIYALVDSGVLVLMRPTGRTIDKSVNLQVPAAYALAASSVQVAAACAQGIVRLFASRTLVFRATLPRFVARGQEQAAGAGSIQGSIFPDARGCSFAPTCRQQLIVSYADQSVFLWNVEDTQKITCTLSLSAHSGCVWDVCPLSTPVLPAAGHEQPARVATCAADGSIRFWNVTGSGGRLLTGTACVPASDGRAQLRCMRMSPDCRHIIIGDFRGNLRVYDSVTLKPTIVHEAHDDEILCLDYSPVGAGGRSLAASGSRDTLIHIYDVQSGYELVETLDDHSAAVTAVRFTGGGRGLVSCGADRSIIFRLLGSGPDAGSATYHIETLPHSLLYDLAVHPLEQYLVTTGQDGLLRQWDVTTGALQRTLAPEAGAGEPTRLCIDPGGVVLICCHSDGCLRLYNLATGQLMWRAWGHADMVASAAVTPDLTRLVSVGGDGCVIVWKLPEQLVRDIQAAVHGVAAARVQFFRSHHSKQQDDKTEGAADLRSEPASSKSAALSPLPCSQPGTSPLQQVGKPSYAAAAGFATPPNVLLNSDKTSSSDSAVSSTLLRLKQGRPLVSTDKLPKWARSPSLPSSPVSPAARAGRDQPDGGWPKAGQQVKGKWRVDEEPQIHIDESQPVVEVNAARILSLDTTSTDAEVDPRQEQHTGDDPLTQQEWSGWSQDDDMVVIQDWDNSSLATYEPQATALIEEALDEDGERLTSQPETPVVHEGGPEVVRDLFKQHFSSLDDDRAVQPLQREHRQSLSAMFKAGRGSLCEPLPLSVQKASSCLDNRLGQPAVSAASAQAVNGVLPSTVADQTPADDIVNAEESDPAAESQTASGRSQQAEAPVGGEQLLNQQNGARKRWRHGKMDQELADMRQRLANLHALYQEQQLQRQASPRRSKHTCDSTDGATDEAEQQQTQGHPDTTAGSHAAVKRSKVAQVERTASGIGLTSSLNKSDDNSPNTQGLDASNSSLGKPSRSNSIEQASNALLHSAHPALPHQHVGRQEDEIWCASAPLPSGPVPQTSVIKLPTAAAAVAECCGPSLETRDDVLAAGPVQVEEDSSVAQETVQLCEPTVLGEKTQSNLLDAAAGLSAEHVVTAESQQGPQLVENVGHVARACHDPAVGADSQASDDSGLQHNSFSSAIACSPASPAPPTVWCAKDACHDNHLLAALLADSPEPSPNDDDSVAAAPSSMAAKLAKLRRGVQPRSFDPFLTTVGSPASSEQQLAHGADSPTPAVRLQQRLLSDSEHRVSIGTSITACEHAASSAARMVEQQTAGGDASGSDSPQQPAVSLLWSRSGDGDAKSRELSESLCFSGLMAPGADIPVAGASRSHSGKECCNTAGQNAASGSGLLSETAAREGVSVTPHGQHTVWPGWGSSECWTGLTPSPSQGSVAHMDVAPQAATSQAALATDADAKYWLQQNPCFDMTPAGSTPGTAYPSQNGTMPFDVDPLARDNSSPRAVSARQSISESSATPDSEDTRRQPEVRPTEDSVIDLSDNRLSTDSTVTDGKFAVQPDKQQGGVLSHPQSHRGQQAEQDAQITTATLSGALDSDMPQVNPPTTPSGQQDASLVSEGTAPEHTQQQLYTPQQQSPSQQPSGQPQHAGGISLPGSSSMVSPGSGTMSSDRSGALQMRRNSDTMLLSSPGSSKGKDKAQLKREKAAAKAAAKAATSLQRSSSDVCALSPGSSMLSLLQRIKRTMPGMRRRTSSTERPSTAFAVSSLQEDQPDNSPFAPCRQASVVAMQKAEAQVEIAEPQSVMLDSHDSNTIGVDSLGAWACSQDKQQAELKQQHLAAHAIDEAAAFHDSSISVHDVKLELQESEQPAVELKNDASCTPNTEYNTPEPTATDAAQKQSAPDTTSLAQVNNSDDSQADAVGSGQCSSAARLRTAAQFAESIGRFKQSVQEMQQLWLQLQSLSLDSQDATELLPLLTPPTATAATGSGTAPPSRRSSSQPVQQPASASVQATPPGLEVPADVGDINSCGPHNQAEPVVLVKQRLQDELLSSIWDLHATVTGLSCNQLNTGSVPGCGFNSPERTPLQPWQMQSLHSKQQLGSNTGASGSDVFGTPPSTKQRWYSSTASDAAGSPGSPTWSGLSPGGPSKDVLEEVTSRICEQYTDILIKKLEKNRQTHSSPAKGRHVRIHRQCHQQKHQQKHQ